MFRKLLMIADDLTGALDTGIKFADRGIRTRLCMGLDRLDLRPDDRVVALCEPTRHVSPARAERRMVLCGQKAKELGFDMVFKKTDSALRGNVGPELCGILKGTGYDRLVFLPALPSMDRYVEDGRLYIGGIPASRSVFASDPLDPVRQDSVQDILKSRLDMQKHAEYLEKIQICDCRTESDIADALERAETEGPQELIAGCSGLAGVLADIVSSCDLDGKASADTAAGRGISFTAFSSDGGKYRAVFCGSLNPLSLAQMDLVEKSGIPRIHIGQGADVPVEEKMLYDTLALKCSAEEVAERSGLFLKNLILGEAADSLMVIGGDTLLAMIKALGDPELELVCEPSPGLVRIRLTATGRSIDLYTKSGGFGKDDLLVRFLDGDFD